MKKLYIFGKLFAEPSFFEGVGRRKNPCGL